MNPEPEIQRLRELMPASGRMLVKIVSKPQQSGVLDVPFPPPWQAKSRPIYINFDLWRQLSKAQRDLLLLREVSWLLGVRWFRPDWYRALVLVGAVGAVGELSQGDAIGFLVGGGLSAIALRQIWQGIRSSQKEIEADEAALKVALRRGYNPTEAAEVLLAAIEAVARIEGRSSLNFQELIRCQNLKAMANLSTVQVPERVRQE